jgi:epoxyqueuosine reductase
MIELLEKEIHKHGDKFRIIPVERLRELKNEIDDFKSREDLNGFQMYIANSMYRFDLPDADFMIRSVIIIASPVPAYAKVIFHWKGKRVSLISLARSYIGKKDAATATKRYLTQLLKPSGYHIKSPLLLPLKRLAVKSGLAEYGRNNICYVDGMGSFLTLVAYYTDLSCTQDNWYEIRNMDNCSSCTACMKNCPTGAILKERFLINNERCLSYFNEGPGDFPDWLPKSAHNCLYDCLLCQKTCPQNKYYMDNIIGPIEFEEAETDLLLSGKSLNELPLALKKKVVFLGMDQWISAIPRNIKVLLENSEM